MTQDSTLEAILVPEHLHGERTDRGLSLLLGVSRSRVARELEEGLVWSDDHLSKKTPLKAGSKIYRQIAPHASPASEPPSFDPEPVILLQKKDYLVVEKPKGLPTHADDRHQYSLIESLRSRGMKLSQNDTDRRYDGIVHRLDKDTSGVLIVSSSEEGQAYFREIFRERRVRKHYKALAHLQQSLAPRGIIKAPLGRSHTDPRKRAISISGDSKEAETHYTVESTGTDWALLGIELLTGRTHQIRVHLESIGAPIYGDVLYGIPCPQDWEQRMYLHASRLEFFDPDDEHIILESDQEIKHWKTMLNIPSH